MNNFPRNAAGATVTLTSGDPNVVQVPSTVLVPQGALAANFSGTTSFVPGIKGISVKAVYNGSQVTGTISVNPTPTVTIVSAEYFTDTQLFKVQASTSWANSIMTFGTDPNSGPLGTMQFELGAWKGSMLMATAPTQATVWNSNGGQATVAVIIKTPATGGGGGGTATTFKLTTAKNGKGTVTVSPVAASYAARTVVSVTATPDPGSPWIGWTGACAGTATTCTVTMNSNLSVTANFK